MKNTLILKIAKIPLIYVPKISQMVVRHEMGLVILFIDQKCVELTTLTAHDIGYQIHTAKLAPNEMIVLSINGEEIELLWSVAKKLATGLLRKADDADDWQRKRRGVRWRGAVQLRRCCFCVPKSLPVGFATSTRN